MPLECSIHSSLRAHRFTGAAAAAISCLCALTMGTLGAEGVSGRDAEGVSSAGNLAGATPRFAVTGFKLKGSRAFSSEEVLQAMKSATGPSVTLTELRAALVQLQELYRARGLGNVVLTIPQQSLIDGVVEVEVAEARGTDAAPAVPALLYAISRFEIRGHSRVSEPEILSLLLDATGPAISLEAVQAALSKVRDLYLSRGFTRAQVTLPRQVLSDGVIRLDIVEGHTLQDEALALAARSQPVPEPPAPPVKTFAVARYDVPGNTLLSDQIVDKILAQGVGTNVSVAQIQKTLGDLQLAYRERGFATVGVSLPQQQITNATVKVLVTEGRLTAVQLVGNRYFSSNNVLRALPSLSTNAVFNNRVFQQELDQANQNRDRQIYPSIGPGPEPGTSALSLRVKDRLPLHGRVDVNNHSTPGTPNWRVNASVNYGNLWQREHQMGLSYGFTPERYKSPGVIPDYLVNRPLIANYGAYYRLPFGEARSVQDQIDSSSGRFGYDEATRQFRLPPAGQRPDLTVYTSASYSDTGTKFGPRTLVTTNNNPLLTIQSQDAGQNFTINEGIGTRLNIPFAVGETRRLGLSGGLDLKRYVLDSLNTNNFFITTIITNISGSQTNTTLKPSPQPARNNEIVYLPLSLGLDYSQQDRSGFLSANLAVNWNVVGDGREFAALSYTPSAKATYYRTTLSLNRDQRVFGDWSLLARASGQITDQPLLSNEQFAAGGINSVRGYFEGDAYGDLGWFGSVELRTPFFKVPVPAGASSVPGWLRGSVFLDFSRRYFVEDNAGGSLGNSLMGAGLGVSGNINNRLDMKLTLGWPLRESANTRLYDLHAYFSVGGQF